MDEQSGLSEETIERIGGTIITAFKVFMFLSAIPMCLLWLFLGVMLLNDMSEPVAMRLSWQPTACRITASDVGRDWRDRYTFEVEYVCQIDSKEYTFDKYRKDNYGSRAFASVQALAERYPVGGEVTAYISPDEPYQAVLERSRLWVMALMALFLVGSALVGIGFLYAFWGGKGRLQKEKKQSRPLSSPKKAGSGEWIGVVFGGFFFLTGLAVLAYTFLIPAYHVLDASSWVEVPCKIVSSRVHVEVDSEGNDYSVDIFYSYTFDGREYQSNRYSFFDNLSGSKRGQEKIASRYPAGSDAVCYVDPDNPRSVVLDRGFTVNIPLLLFPLLFMAVGGLIFFSLLKSIFAPSIPKDGWQPKRAPTSAPREIVLKPDSTSSTGCLILLLVVGLFGSGIAVGFVRQSDFSGLNCVVALSILFGLVGLWSTFLFFTGLRATLINPRPVLIVERDTLPLGESFKLRWMFEGQVSRIQHLSLRLIGREAAEYTIGTSSYTDENDFYVFDIVNSSEPAEIAQGRAQLTVPRETMHSFASTHNKIVWLLQVTGDMGETRWIPKIANIHHEYRIVVLPLPAGETA